MANGGWTGTSEEWLRLEAPLLGVDAELERFATDHKLILSRNLKDWPERSLCWGENPSCLMQLYLADAERLVWNLWLCCTHDRRGERFWRNEFAVHEKAMSCFVDDLPLLLADGYSKVNAWRAVPEQLEFAAKLAPPPEL